MDLLWGPQPRQPPDAWPIMKDCHVPRCHLFRARWGTLTRQRNDQNLRIGQIFRKHQETQHPSQNMVVWLTSGMSGKIWRFQDGKICTTLYNQFPGERIMYLVLPTAWFERWFLQLFTIPPNKSPEHWQDKKEPCKEPRIYIILNQGFTSFYIPSFHIISYPIWVCLKIGVSSQIWWWIIIFIHFPYWNWKLINIYIIIIFPTIYWNWNCMKLPFFWGHETTIFFWGVAALFSDRRNHSFPSGARAAGDHSRQTDHTRSQGTAAGTSWEFVDGLTYGKLMGKWKNP